MTAGSASIFRSSPTRAFFADSPFHWCAVRIPTVSRHPSKNASIPSYRSSIGQRGAVLTRSGQYTWARCTRGVWWSSSIERQWTPPAITAYLTLRTESWSGWVSRTRLCRIRPVERPDVTSGLRCRKRRFLPPSRTNFFPPNRSLHRPTVSLRTRNHLVQCRRSE